jgi:hypothetical protein
MLCLTSSLCCAQAPSGAIENKNISICHLEKDTISYKDLSNCKLISVEGKNSEEIISYVYRYSILSEGQEKFSKMSSNGSKIEQMMIDGTINNQSKKIVIDSVIVKDGENLRYVGYRIIYLK